MGQRQPVGAAELGELVALVDKGTLSGKLGKEVFSKMFESGKTAPEIIEAEGLRQISDTGELEQIISEVLARSRTPSATVPGWQNGRDRLFLWDR